MTKERSTALQQTGSGGHGQQQQQHHHQRPETQVNSNNNYPHGRYHQRTRKPPPAPGAAASLSAADYSPLGSSSASSSTGNGNVDGTGPGRQLSSAATTEIQCAVHNVFPLPELTIYQVLSDGLRPRSLENARLAQNITQLSNGAFDVSVTAYIEDIELLQQQQQPQYKQHNQQAQTKLPMKPTPTTFECLVSQDELRHELRKRTRYTITFGLFINSKLFLFTNFASLI